MAGKKGVKCARKMPSERIDTPYNKMVRLFTEIGHPVPVVPIKYKNKPDEYWQMMREKVENGLKMIRILNDALDHIEETSPEFAQQLPWYAARKAWKEQGGKIDEDHLRIELLAFYQKNFDGCIFRSSFVRSPGKDAYVKEEIRDYMRARRKIEKEKEE